MQNSENIIISKLAESFISSRTGDLNAQKKYMTSSIKRSTLEQIFENVLKKENWLAKLELTENVKKSTLNQLLYFGLLLHEHEKDEKFWGEMIEALQEPIKERKEEVQSSKNRFIFEYRDSDVQKTSVKRKGVYEMLAFLHKQSDDISLYLALLIESGLRKSEIFDIVIEDDVVEDDQVLILSNLSKKRGADQLQKCWRHLLTMKRTDFISNLQHLRSSVLYKKRMSKPVRANIKKRAQQLLCDGAPIFKKLHNTRALYACVFASDRLGRGAPADMRLMVI